MLFSILPGLLDPALVRLFDQVPDEGDLGESVSITFISGAVSRAMRPSLHRLD